MRVCVTGGTGFLGGFLVRDLFAKGATVRVLARPSPRADALQGTGVEIIHGDLADADSISRAVNGADIVYHLAAKVGAAKMSDYFATNVAVGSIAAFYCTEEGQLTVGIEINTSHIRKVSEGYVTGTAKPLHIGTTSQVWEILIRDDKGQLISASRLRVAILHA